MPLKEYVCAAHGDFEAYSATCPHGCPEKFVKQEIRTAPAYRSPKTGFTDHTLKGLAADFGLSDVKNDKAGGSVMDALRKSDDFRPRWGQHSKEISGSLGAVGVRAENNYSPMAGSLSKQIPTRIEGRYKG